MTIKAIETVYAGYRFRSRLEARWAVLFNRLGMRFEYEHQGYELQNGDWYLPDFELANHNQIVEVRGDRDRLIRDLPKLKRLCAEAGQDVVLLWSIPDVFPESMPIHPVITTISGETLVTAGFLSGKNHISFMPTLMPYEIEHIGEHYNLAGITPAPLVADAYAAARRARFEHGENGS